MAAKGTLEGFKKARSLKSNFYKKMSIYKILYIYLGSEGNLAQFEVLKEGFYDSAHVHELTDTLFLAGGGGGGWALLKVLCGKARGPNPYPFIYHF